MNFCFICFDFGKLFELKKPFAFIFTCSWLVVFPMLTYAERLFALKRGLFFFLEVFQTKCYHKLKLCEKCFKYAVTASSVSMHF